MLESSIPEMRHALQSVRHDMQPAGLGLSNIVARSLRKAPAEQAPLLAWPLACGSSVAERTHALDFAEGILRVEVTDAGWRKELQALAPRYVAAINRYVAQKVTRVEFVVGSRK
jgi:hypothetical protein